MQLRRNSLYKVGIGVSLLLPVVLLLVVATRSLSQQQTNQRLIVAIKNHDVATVTDVLREGADPQAVEVVPKQIPSLTQIFRKSQPHPDQYQTALALSINALQNRSHVEHRQFQANLDIMYLLVMAGADVNAKDENGFTPVVIFLRLGENDIVDFLIKQGATFHHFNEVEWGAIMDGLSRPEISLSTIRAAMNAGFDCKRASYTGGTFLMFAVLSDRLDIVRMLKSIPVDLTAQDVSGKTALDYARSTRSKNSRAIVEELSGK